MCISSMIGTKYGTRELYFNSPATRSALADSKVAF